MSAFVGGQLSSTSRQRLTSKFSAATAARVARKKAASGAIQKTEFKWPQYESVFSFCPPFARALMLVCLTVSQHSWSVKITKKSDRRRRLRGDGGLRSATNSIKNMRLNGFASSRPCLALNNVPSLRHQRCLRRMEIGGQGLNLRYGREQAWSHRHHRPSNWSMGY